MTETPDLLNHAEASWKQLESGICRHVRNLLCTYVLSRQIDSLHKHLPWRGCWMQHWSKQTQVSKVPISGLKWVDNKSYLVGANLRQFNIEISCSSFPVHSVFRGILRVICRFSIRIYILLQPISSRCRNVHGYHTLPSRKNFEPGSQATFIHHSF